MTAQSTAGDELWLLRSTLSNLAEAIIVAEVEPHAPDRLRVVRVNDAFTRLTGYTRREALGADPCSLPGLVPYEAARSAIGAALRATKSLQLELVHCCYDQAEVWVELRLTPIRDAAGRATHWLWVERDITRRKRTEERLRASDERFLQSFNASPDPMLINDFADGRYLYVNDSFLRASGYGRDEVIGRNTLELNIWADPTDSPRLMRLLEERGRFQQEVRFRLKSGEVRAGIFFAQVIDIAGARCILCLVNDVTEKRRNEEALRASEERYALAARGANDGLWDWDVAANKIYFSPRWKAMLGFEEHEIGDDPVEWLNRIHAEDRPLFRVELKKWFRSAEEHFEQEYRVEHKSGAYRWALCRGICVRGDAGSILRVVGSMTDISERKAAEQQLIFNAFHDQLTGLPNRSLFVDRLEQALKRSHRRRESTCAVLFLDLDRFKIINDSLGHQAGDALIVAVARRLESCVRSRDTVARLGGDEFTVLLDEVESTHEAIRLAERVREKLARPFVIQGRELFVTASVGIAFGQAENTRASDLIRDADAAMYRAKAAGAARYQVYDPQMHAQALARLSGEAELRRALGGGEMVDYYQPVVDLATGRIVGTEVLVRWEHPERGLIFPAEFIAMAEETGLIIALNRWLIPQACRQTRLWQEQFQMPLKLSVNVTGKQFAQPNLVEDIELMLSESGLGAGSLNVEIVESVLIDQQDGRMLQTLETLRAHGINLSIDGFGTGYSCLSYLHLYPIGTLKIDRSFVSRLGTETKHTEIVRTIISLAHSLGIEVVAEGVETGLQAAKLIENDCKYGQGFLYSKAVKAEVMEDLLRRQQRSDGGREKSIDTSSLAIPLR